MPQPATWFAPAGRATPVELNTMVRLVGESPVVEVLLESVGGAMLVLNEERQILAANAGALEMLGLDGPNALVGRRPGEAFGCVAVHEGPDGCGTSRRCSTCGAILAVLAARAEHGPIERECLLTAESDEGQVAYEFTVRATPLEVEGRTITIVVLQDVSAEKRRRALERVFFHDLMNVVGGISGWSQVIEMLQGQQVKEAAQRIVALSERLAHEVKQQRSLVMAERGELAVDVRDVSPARVLADVRLVFSGHRVAAGRELRVVVPAEAPDLPTDPALLERVLVNMVKNALEATPEGGTVVLEYRDDDGPTFMVWNAGCMSEGVALQIFRRSFSTKGEVGRGLGTYSMKLFGERYLGGRVGFSSDEQEGTTFRIRLPAGGPARRA